MRVVIAPVLVGDRICRIVAPIASLLEVEEWVGEWWEPSTVTLTTASQSPAAAERLLEARGVPASDRVATERIASDAEIQASLRALEPLVNASARIEDSVGGRPNGPRRREYSGNARFRRPPAAASRDVLDRADLRRTPSDDSWQGPRRRASDPPASDPARGPKS